MAFSFTKLADQILDDLLPYQLWNKLKNNTRFLNEDVLGDPAVNSNQVSLGARSPGWTSNLEISYSAGTLTISGWNGVALSSTNPGWVCVPSTTAGRNVVLKVTTNFSFNDDSNASSHLTNFFFGVTSGVNWQKDVPFFLYAINRNDSEINGSDGNSVIGFSRNPCMSETQDSSTRIGDTGAIASNPVIEDCTFIMRDVTVSNYISLNCSVIGAFRMRFLGATNDWTVQTLGKSDGIGFDKILKTCAKTWEFPTGHKGAISSGYHNSIGTAPVFLSNSSDYQLLMDGTIIWRLAMITDGGTDGVGANNLILYGPTDGISSSSSYGTNYGDSVSLGRVTYGASSAIVSIENSTRSGSFLMKLANGTTLKDGDFPNGNREIKTQIIYKAFANKLAS